MEVVLVLKSRENILFDPNELTEIMDHNCGNVRGISTGG